MRRTLSAAMLVLAFCCPASAGVIHNPPPEPPPLTESIVLETSGAETTGAGADEPGWSDYLTDVTFDLLTVLSALF